MPCQKSAHAGQCAARTYADHNRIDIALHLVKDFGSSCALVRFRIGGIGELIDVDCPGEYAQRWPRQDLDNNGDGLGLHLSV